MSGRVLSVTVASASGHVIVERFYERLPETIQMMWRRRLHEASEASLGERGSATLDAPDFARVEEGCGVARHGEDCMVWCGVGDLRFYAVGSGQYDEFGRASLTPPPPVHPPSTVPSPPSRARPRNHSSSASPVPPSPRRFADRTPRSPSPVPDIAVAEVLQALVTAIAAVTKKRFDESKVFEHYGMICLALDDIVVDGHVESVSWDQIRRTAKMKLAAET
jgi:hypothetical protein